MFSTACFSLERFNEFNGLPMGAYKVTEKTPFEEMDQSSIVQRRAERFCAKHGYPELISYKVVEIEQNSYVSFVSNTGQNISKVYLVKSKGLFGAVYPGIFEWIDCY